MYIFIYILYLIIVLIANDCKNEQPGNVSKFLGVGRARSRRGIGGRNTE